MMLNKFFTVAAAIVQPVVLAVSSPGAPSNLQAPAHGLSSDVANALAFNAKPDFEAGQCKFHAQVLQQCNGAKSTTSITIPSFVDNANQVITEPAFGLAVNLDHAPWNITGLGEDFFVEVQDNIVNYVYGQAVWTSVQSLQSQGKFECAVGSWSSADLTCSSENASQLRSQEMDCTFECSPYTTFSPANNHPVKRMELVEKIKRQMAVVASTTSTPMSNAPTSTPSGSSPTVPYVHGVCSFNMRLCNQCQFNTQENWHSEVLGDLNSIQDNNHTTVVTYPNGAGRIDKGAVRLKGLGDFRLAWDSKAQQVLFSFNGATWSTVTVDDGHEAGLCKIFPWDKPVLNCTEANGVQERASEVVCVFRC